MTDSPDEKTFEVGPPVPLNLGSTHVHHHAGFAGAVLALRNTIMVIGLYLGVGALCHAWQAGIEFQPGSMWSWGWLLAWPVGLVVIAAKWVGIILLGVLIAAALMWAGWVIYKAIDIRLWHRRQAEVDRKNVETAQRARAAAEGRPAWGGPP